MKQRMHYILAAVAILSSIMVSAVSAQSVIAADAAFADQAHCSDMQQKHQSPACENCRDACPMHLQFSSTYMQPSVPNGQSSRLVTVLYYSDTKRGKLTTARKCDLPPPKFS